MTLVDPVDPVDPADPVEQAGVRMHDWVVEEREYRRMEQRRGRRHGFESLDAARTALVVVDMVDFFVTENPYARGIVSKVDLVATTLRDAGGTVAWVLPADITPRAVDVERLGPRVAEMFAATGGDGALRDRVWAGLTVHDQDVVVEKSAYSALFPGASPLDGLLRGRGVDTVLVTGTVTNVCCEATARDAQTLGYRVVMVADGCAAMRDRDHNATLHTVYRSYGDVRPAAELIGLLG